MSRINPSWNRRKGEDVHSPEGVIELKQWCSDAMFRKYSGLAETEFRWEFTGEQYDLMQELSWGTVPELPVYRSGKVASFEDPATGDVQILPFTARSQALNIYGMPASWGVVPVGWTVGTSPAPATGSVVERYMNLELNLENSVIIKNDMLGSSEQNFISTMVQHLVDNVLTLSQLNLLARVPYMFDVSEDNLLSAKNFYLAVSSGAPVIFTNRLGEDLTPKIVDSGVTIDPALFDIFDRFECLILEQLGYPCVPITKRAQQSIAEVSTSDDKITCRRKEKYFQRQFAAERMEKLFGGGVEVESVLDSLADEREMADMQQDVNNARDNVRKEASE